MIWHLLVASTCPPSASISPSNLLCSSPHVFSSIAGVTLPIAILILLFNSWTFLIGAVYTLLLYITPKKEISKGSANRLLPSSTLSHITCKRICNQNSDSSIITKVIAFWSKIVPTLNLYTMVFKIRQLFSQLAKMWSLGTPSRITTD